MLNEFNENCSLVTQCTTTLIPNFSKFTVNSYQIHLLATITSVYPLSLLVRVWNQINILAYLGKCTLVAHLEDALS